MLNENMIPHSKILLPLVFLRQEDFISKSLQVLKFVFGVIHGAIVCLNCQIMESIFNVIYSR